MLPLKRGRDVARRHVVLTVPRAFVDMRLADALVSLLLAPPPQSRLMRSQGPGVLKLVLTYYTATCGGNYVIVRPLILSEHQRVTDGQIDRRTDGQTRRLCLRRAVAERDKTHCKIFNAVVLCSCSGSVQSTTCTRT